MDTENVVAFPGAQPGQPPYIAWLARRFPDGIIGYDPPLDAFLGSPETRNAWTSYVPEGGEPVRLRMSLYLRRDWRGEPGTLCLGNAHPAGEDAPRSWDAGAVGLLREAVTDLEARAAAAGFTRIAITGPSPEARDAYLAMGYRVAGDELAKDLAKDLAGLDS